MTSTVCKALWIALAIVGSAFAQEFRATIGGMVTDPSGAPVPNAKVTVTSVERNISTEANSNEIGRYLVQYLLPGTYNMTVEKAGFRRLVREKIQISSSSHLGLDLALELGQLADSIDVVGE